MKNGEICPNCGKSYSKVIDKRMQRNTGIWRRRRECLHCGARWNTIEIREEQLEVIDQKKGK